MFFNAKADKAGRNSAKADVGSLYGGNLYDGKLYSGNLYDENLHTAPLYHPEVLEGSFFLFILTRPTVYIRMHPMKYIFYM